MIKLKMKIPSNIPSHPPNGRSCDPLGFQSEFANDGCIVSPTMNSVTVTVLKNSRFRTTRSFHRSLKKLIIDS